MKIIPQRTLVYLIVVLMMSEDIALSLYHGQKLKDKVRSHLVKHQYALTLGLGEDLTFDDIVDVVYRGFVDYSSK